MLVIRFFNNPYRTRGALTGRISDELTEMIVIRVLNLILNDNRLIRPRNFRKDIN